MVWKEDWLDAASHDEPLTLSPVLKHQEARARSRLGKLFNCQYTELTRASRPGTASGMRGLLEPWIVGNVTAGGWWVVALVRAFNAFQELRGGASNDKLTGDLGYIRYNYLGAPSDLFYDFNEFGLVLGYDFGVVQIQGAVRYSPNFFANSGNAWYKWGQVTVPIPLHLQ